MGLKPYLLSIKKVVSANQLQNAFVGMTIAEARQAVIDELQKEGLLAKVTNYQHQVGHLLQMPERLRTSAL